MIEISVSAEGVDLTTPLGLRRYDYDDGEETLSREVTLGDAVAERIARELMKDDRYQTLRSRVLEIRDEVVREQLGPIVRGAIQETVEQTNAYGERTGKTTTLRELIVAEVGKVLNRKPDPFGGRSKTLVEKVVAEEVDGALRKELSAVLAEEKAKVVAAIRAKAADLIAQAVKEGVGR